MKMALQENKLAVHSNQQRPLRFPRGTFPIHALPVLAIEATLQMLTVQELYAFALVSPQYQQFVKATRKGESIRCACMKITDDSVRIILRTMIQNNRDLVNFYFGYRKEYPGIEENHVIGGLERKFIRVENDGYYIYGRWNRRIVVALLTFLKDTFRFHFSSIILSSGSRSLHEAQELIEIVETCEKLSINACYGTKPHNLDRDFGNLVNALTVTEEFFEAVEHLHRPFVRQLSLGANVIDIEHSRWITPEQFLAFDCRRISLEKSHLTAKTVSAFMAQWYHSSNTKLREVIVESNDLYGNLDLSGMNLEPTLLRNPLNYENYTSQNIIRTDGYTASVTSYIDEGVRNFEIFVNRIQIVG